MYKHRTNFTTRNYVDCNHRNYVDCHYTQIDQDSEDPYELFEIFKKYTDFNEFQLYLNNVRLTPNSSMLRIKTGIIFEKSFILECFFASFTFCSCQMAVKLLSLFEFGFGETIYCIFPRGKIQSLYVMQKPILFVLSLHSMQIKA